MAKPSSMIAMRNIIASGDFYAVPSCFDALSARIVEQAGCPLTFMSGFSVAAARAAAAAAAAACGSGPSTALLGVVAALAAAVPASRRFLAAGASSCNDGKAAAAAADEAGQSAIRLSEVRRR